MHCCRTAAQIPYVLRPKSPKFMVLPEVQGVWDKSLDVALKWVVWGMGAKELGAAEFLGRQAAQRAAGVYTSCPAGAALSAAVWTAADLGRRQLGDVM